jgi:hypothetical protein
MHSLGVLPTSRVPPVFTAAAQDETLSPEEFIPMEHMAEDDDLVYPVMSSPSTLHFTRALAGYKSLSFEGLLAGVYVEALADSGATHSFASASFLQNNGISFQPVSVPDARLADGTSVRIMGLTSALVLNMVSFRSSTHFW